MGRGDKWVGVVMWLIDSLVVGGLWFGCGCYVCRYGFFIMNNGIGGVCMMMVLLRWEVGMMYGDCGLFVNLCFIWVMEILYLWRVIYVMC